MFTQMKRAAVVLTAATLVTALPAHDMASADDSCTASVCTPSVPTGLRTCRVDVGDCSPESHCIVNVGACYAGSNCTVNVGSCESGDCVLNVGVCRDGEESTIVNVRDGS